MLKKLLYAFIAGLCLAIFHGYILHPVYLTIRYGKKIENILKQRHGEYDYVFILVQVNTKYVTYGTILNTGQRFLIEGRNFDQDSHITVLGAQQ